MRSQSAPCRRVDGAAVIRRSRAWRFAVGQFSALQKALDGAAAGGMVDVAIALPDIAINLLEVLVSQSPAST